MVRNGEATMWLVSDDGDYRGARFIDQHISGKWFIIPLGHSAEWGVEYKNLPLDKMPKWAIPIDHPRTITITSWHHC
jgi:hypothetical protein